MINFTDKYPHKGPTVFCLYQEIEHPNIGLDRQVRLPILTEDWNPVLTINIVIFALELMLLEPMEDQSSARFVRDAFGNCGDMLEEPMPQSRAFVQD